MAQHAGRSRVERHVLQVGPVEPGQLHQVGQAKLTGGYRLPARFIIHTVGPVWHGGEAGEPALLAACYRNSLLVAAAHGVATIAFPGISTGVYGYPKALAADVAVSAVASFASNAGTVREVVFCCFSDADLALYRQRLPSAPD